MTPRGLTHTSKRIRQTAQLFRNFPEVLYDLSTFHTPLRRDEMTFRLRNGYTVTCPNADGTRFPVYEIFADDAYELDNLTAGVDREAAVLDIGGQIGMFALAMARALPFGKVHVYEASPTSAGWVQRNVENNGLGGRVTVHPRALAGEEGEFTFIDSGTASGHNGLTAPDFLIEQGAKEVTVPAVSFDQAVAAVRAEGREVQIVKMDIEGAEYDAILNSSPDSWSDVRKVVMEYHPVDGHSLEQLLDFFAPLGITAARIDPGEREGLGLAWLERTDAAA